MREWSFADPAANRRPRVPPAECRPAPRRHPARSYAARSRKLREPPAIDLEAELGLIRDKCRPGAIPVDSLLAGDAAVRPRCGTSHPGPRAPRGSPPDWPAAKQYGGRPPKRFADDITRARNRKRTRVSA